MVFKGFVLLIGEKICQNLFCLFVKRKVLFPLKLSSWCNIYLSVYLYSIHNLKNIFTPTADRCACRIMLPLTQQHTKVTKVLYKTCNQKESWEKPYRLGKLPMDFLLVVPTSTLEFLSCYQVQSN